jgi:acyl carrier protein
MEEPIESTILEYKKSIFQIDLIQRNSGLKYVAIKQTIKEQNENHLLKIDSTILVDIIFVLESYLKKISASTIVGKNAYFSDIKQQSIIERYLKGLNIADLAMQFDCSNEIIELIIRNRNIPLVDNIMPKPRKKSYYRRRRK